MITALLLYICTSPLSCQVYAQKIWRTPDQAVVCEKLKVQLTNQLTEKNRRTTRFECDTQPTSNAYLEHNQTRVL